MTLTVIFIAVGLSMDALAVSIGKGISVGGNKLMNALEVAFFFGLFQFLMPLAGYYLGSSFSGFIGSFDHWIAFGLLFLIGVKMIRESFGKEEREEREERISFPTLMFLSLATSIDALAVGVSFAVLKTPILLASAVIGVICFVFSFTGFIAGNRLGRLFGRKLEFLGGAILIAIGVKVLLEHLL